jgi:teichuronic acid exporter
VWYSAEVKDTPRTRTILARLVPFVPNLQNDFLRHNAVFFVGSLVVAVVNYLYHPIMSRMMSVSDFGEVQVLFSIFTQLSLITVVAHTILLNLYTNRHTDLSESVVSVVQLTLCASYTLAFVLAVASPLLVRTLSLSSPLPLLFVSLAIVLTTHGVFGRAPMQAAKQFVATSLANTISAVMKLVASVLLVLVGYGAGGAMLGLCVAALATAYYVRGASIHTYTMPTFSLPSLNATLNKELRFAGIVLFGIGIVTFFTTADIVFAKYLFTSEAAGHYAGISVIAKMIYFATASIAGVLLTHVTLAHSRQESSRVLLHALGITLLLGACALFVFTLFPTLVVSLLLGRAYTDMTPFLPILGVGVLFTSLLNIGVNYGIALRRKSVIIFGLCGVGATLLFVAVLPHTPLGLSLSFAGGALVALVLMLALYVVHDRFSRS